MVCYNNNKNNVIVIPSQPPYTGITCFTKSLILIRERKVRTVFLATSTEMFVKRKFSVVGLLPVCFKLTC